MALEALYELDQSDHDLEAVLLHRAQALIEDALATPDGGGPRLALALAVAAAPVFVAEPADGPAADGWSEPLPAAERDALAAACGVDAAAVEAAHAKVTTLRTQAAYGAAIVRGVVRARERIDAVIAEIAPEWPVPQMAPVDRNLLRIALWEIASGSAPLRVVINEAVEMAREYVGESTRRMVNGALGSYSAGPQPLRLEGGV